jgi:hypothetical protein
VTRGTEEQMHGMDNRIEISTSQLFKLLTVTEKELRRKRREEKHKARLERIRQEVKGACVEKGAMILDFSVHKAKSCNF